MSKIYEALLRAEMERAAATDQPFDTGPHASQLSQTPSHLLDFDRSSVLDVPAIAISPDLASVSMHPWNPSLPQLPALDDRGSSVEQLRSLRSHMHEFRDLNPLKSILVSSGLPKEGKSFVAANLAISFARHKASRVLLIDGDMRRSTLHKLLGCPNTPGLSEYLSGNATATEIMQRAKPDATGVPLHPGLASLTFIAGGVDTEAAAELSGNARFAELIATLSPHFDWIVVDSSPVNLVADAVNLARACDAVLLVVRGGVTRFEMAQRALTELKAYNVLGVVLNAVDFTPNSGGYYGYDKDENLEEKPGASGQ
jgi:protein-tyrosine kinase